MPEQSFANHARYVRGFHGVIPTLLLLALAGSVYGLFRAFQYGAFRVWAASNVLLVVAVAILVWYAREFPLKAQDRAIRAEEGLRHFILTGQRLDPRLTVRQVVALRFAGDAEFPELSRRAAEEGLRPSEIKKAIREWRADLYRV
jgi:hypothetical protein